MSLVFKFVSTELNLNFQVVTMSKQQDILSKMISEMLMGCQIPTHIRWCERKPGRRRNYKAKAIT